MVEITKSGFSGQTGDTGRTTGIESGTEVGRLTLRTNCTKCGHDWIRHTKRWSGYVCLVREVDASGNFGGCGCSEVPPSPQRDNMIGLPQLAMMKSVVFEKPEWRQNCRECMVPMTMIQKLSGQVFGDANTLGMEDGWVETQSERWKLAYTQWCLNPTVSDDFWYCKKCQTLWGKVLGIWWSKCSNYTIEWTPEPQQTQWKPITDPGPEPFLGATRCGACNVWREIVERVPNPSTSEGGFVDIHRCPKCFTGDTIKVDPMKVVMFTPTGEMVSGT